MRTPDDLVIKTRRYVRGRRRVWKAWCDHADVSWSVEGKSKRAVILDLIDWMTDYATDRLLLLENSS